MSSEAETQASLRSAASLDFARDERGGELLALKQAGDAEQGGKACDSPKNTGWRPGARWARSDPADMGRDGRAGREAGTDAARQMRRGVRLPDDVAPFDRRLAGVDETAGGADACWAGETRADVARRIAAIPAHQRPPMREMGRRSEAAEHPYKRLPGDDGGKSSGWPEPGMVAVRFGGEGVRPNSVQRRDPGVALASWNNMPSIRYPGDGPHIDKRAAKERRPVGTPAAQAQRVGSNDPGAAVREVAAFFDTGRTTAGTVARVCAETALSHDTPSPFVSSAVETRVPANPSLDDARDERAGALVTTHKIGSRIQIAAACPAARALGIEPGMALTQVRAFAPEVDVRDADPDGDRADLERLARTLARHWTPVVSVSDADGLLLDLTGVSHLHGGEARMAARLVRLLARRGFRARVGIADTAGAAWAAARHAPDAVTILDGDPLAALASCPVAALRVEEATVELLRRLGIDTVAQLAAMPRAPLARRFGPALVRRLDQASGRVPEPLDPVDVPEPIAVEQRFAEPLLTAEPIAHWIGQLVTRLSDALAAAGLGARTVALAATRVDAAVQVVRIGLARPTRDAAHLLRLLVRRIDTLDPGFGIEGLALHVLRADPLGAEALASDLADGPAPDLAPLVDAIVNRIGPRRLWRTRAVESDVPERAVAPSAPLDPPAAPAQRLKRDDVRHLDRRAPDHPWHPRWPRPARLLRRPERLDHVLAELPDHPPRRFTWRGVTHRVVRGDGPERITGEWWRRAGERDAVRDYFRVEDEAGTRFWLFRRGDGERPVTGDLTWYVHGAFS